MSRNLAFMSFFLITIVFQRVHLNNTNCDSPQYLEFGKTGTISCSFTNFLAVLWYSAPDFENGIPTLHYDGFSKTGAGYDSGEFDVDANGSLIIKEIKMTHDSIFKVAHTLSKEHFYELDSIRVIVIVKPDLPFPVINLCGKDNNRCITETDDNTIKCLVRGVRPRISLQLVTRTVEGDKNISNNIDSVPDGSTFTCIVSTTEIFRYSSRLTFVVCKGSGLPWLLDEHESKTLILNSRVDLKEEKSNTIYIRNRERLELHCSNFQDGFVVWKRASSYDGTEQNLLLYSVFMGEKYWDILADYVHLENSSTLVIPSIDVKHEGVYLCVYGNGLTDGMIVYNLAVTVPAYPLIEGCNRQQYCVIEAAHKGNLTCTVTGIRPRVHLLWKTSSGDTGLDILKDELTVRENGRTFDITLVSQYRVRDKTLDKLTVECEVLTRDQNLVGLNMKADLSFAKENEPTTNSAANWSKLVIAVSLPVGLCLVLVTCGVIFRKYTKKRRFTKKLEHVEEMASILKENNLTEMKQQFINELRWKYKDLYDAIQPIPYIQDRPYCVNRVFVESGIACLHSLRGGTEQWIKLNTYRNIFDRTDVHSTRYILEGEPGYGKSTIALQIAYDWCNSIESSPLRAVDILILLRLRQLGGVASIYRAIKQFILPKDSQLSETDIENILTNSNSVVIILDGFDEYPDQDSSTSDINSIIARQMFQEFQVLVTTRMSSPKRYPPSTKRLKLTGFDDEARRYYVRKAVVGNDNDEVSVYKIECCLAQNPILSDLCQVPLFFVLFAHVTHERNEFQDLNSVTSFFRYMISCFHSHMRNKMEDENVCTNELFETEHYDLDKLSFEALNAHKQKLLWDKSEICQLLGQEFYEQYVRIGILVEEKSVSISDDPGTPITEHVQHKTEVRFYHKLFCEWYAAHFLSKYIEQYPNLDLNEYLKHLHPADVHYLYRFACGLSKDTSEKIISYLPTIEGGDKFSLLCMLEETGKFDNIEKTLIQLCSEGIVISGYDNLLLQRSYVQLLEIASRKHIPVEFVDIDCMESVDPYTGTITTKSGLVISSKIPLKMLVISLFDRPLRETEAIDILQFCTKCSSLRVVRFDCCLPSCSFEVTSTLWDLKSRNVIVENRKWFSTCYKLILNLKNGKWNHESNGSEFTREDLAETTRAWKEKFQQTDIKMRKHKLNVYRDGLRKNTISR